MISKARKFPLRSEFLRFRSRAQRHVTPLTTIYYLSSTHSARLSVIVSKKLSKLATTRNWLKRVTYDTLWPLVKDHKIDCIVVFKPLPLPPKQKLAIMQELTHAFSQIIGR